MTGADHTTAGRNQELAAALGRVDALGIEVRASNFPRPAESDVVAGVGTAAAAPMGGQQVIPAIVINHVGSLAIDGEVTGLIVRVDALARLGIDFDQPDVAEIRAIGQPQLAACRIQKYPWIDGIGVFDAIRRGHYAAFFPLVVGGAWVERFAPDHIDGSFRLRPDVGGNIHVVAVAYVNGVGGQSAAR